MALLDKVVAHTPSVSKAFVDSGFKDDVAIHGALLGIDVEQVKRDDTTPGFVPVKRRWVVEQVNGTLMLHRRLVREHESNPASSVSRTLWASTANLVRRLTGRGRAGQQDARAAASAARRLRRAGAVVTSASITTGSVGAEPGPGSGPTSKRTTTGKRTRAGPGIGAAGA